mmetsp:Transcript_32082/g.51405  ORF Transcript_32082/g.51405 Transcript_32082/m.51405 type:complete len:1109 (+) Transcript_32082:54-3380(+)
MSADQFVQTIRATLSNDNTLRNEAEKQFESAKGTQPSQLVEGLFGILLNMSLEQPLREQAAVLLRKCLEKVSDDGSLWLRLGEAPQNVVREKLLQLLEAEQSPPVRKKVADCVQSLANQLISLEEGSGVNNIQEWPALMPTLMRVIMDGSKDAGLRADCLWSVKEMIVSIWPIMLVNGNQTLEVLRTCMADPTSGVCGNATSLLLELLDSTNTKKDREPFAPLAPQVCQVLQRLANDQDPKALNEVLQSFQAETEVVEFIVRSELIPVVCTIAKQHADEGARKLAMEAIVSFFMGAPALLVKDRSAVEASLEVCVAFMLLLDDDVDGWKENDDDDDDESEAFVDVGKNALDRICKAAQESSKSFPVVLEILKPAIAKLFSTGNWKETVCGITILAQIAEYVDEEEVVTQMLGAIKTQLKASHPRVRHAAWGGVAQFSQDHADFLTQANWAQPLMMEFVDGVGDPADRVAERCMEAFQMFGEEAERDDMEPFVPQFMEKLAKRLEGTPALQKKAITFMAVIAGQVEDGFAQYYSQLMPFLKKIIESTVHKVEERVLLGKCFECISLLAKSVGRAAFRNDAEQIMQAMIAATQVPNLPKDDPVKEYMLAASERICGVMKEDFLPLVPHILPGILEKLTLAPKEWDTNNINEEDYQGEVNLMLSRGADGKVKVILMQSSELEDLQNALSCVHTFVGELKQSYSPFVEATAKALLPVFEFDMDEGVRDMGFETWGGLCQAAREAGQGAMTTELVAEFMKRMLPKLEEDSTAQHFDVAAMRTRADGVSCCLKKGGKGILSPEQVKGIGTVAVEALQKSLVRREKFETDKKQALAAGKDAPEEVDEEDEDGFRIALGEVLGALMEVAPDEFAGCSLQPLLVLVEKMLQSGVVADRKLVLFIICDFLGHLGARIHAQWQQLMPILLQDLTNADSALRQPACYGISLAAKDPNFAAMAQQAAEILAKVITETRGRSKKKSEKPAQAAADNALSALVSILQNHQASVASASAQLWEVWYNGMPCQEDEEEGQKNNKILVQLIMSENPAALNLLPKLLAVLVDAYKTDMAEKETSSAIAGLCVKLGEAKLQQVGAGFTEKQKKKLTRIMREAANPVNA